MYKLFVRSILFLFDPEKVHHFTFKFIRIISKIPLIKDTFSNKKDKINPLLSKDILGLKFPNRVGLAAGFDKNALLYNELSDMGFGFIEVGTVTPKPQDGNPKKRLFRLPKDKAVINRMGFNNDGVEKMVERLKGRNQNIIIGGNIGKNKVTPNENALDDYIYSFNSLFDYVNYFVVNVSSPNTPGLRDLQDKEPLSKILNGLQELNNKKEKSKPILLKIAPDLSENQLDDIVEITETTKIHGLIATNTTISRKNLKSNEELIKSIGNGGLSGKPLTQKSTEVIRYLRQKLPETPIIGVGGIHSAKDAIDKLEAGADLIQLYTGFIYEGPSLIKKVNKEILKYYGNN